MKIINIKNVKIGEGLPKIIIPIVGKTEQDLIDEIDFLIHHNIKFDVIEWRVDHFTAVENIEKVKQLAQTIRHRLPNTPILFTFRTANEGGAKAISHEAYIKLNCEIATSQLVDLIDVEIFIGDNVVQTIIDHAHKHHIYIVGSNHDFTKTPNKDDIISRLKKMQTHNADIAKIAVMPNSIQDVLTLLSATAEMTEHYADRPIITMSMGKLGMVSRICGETFGSAMTFGSAKQASAPGQLEAKKLHLVLNILHQS